MSRGDIYWADLAPRSGAEQSGHRPVVLLSNDGFNRIPSWRSVVVIPLTTSKAQGKRAFTVVEIPGGVAGLPKGSFAVCHQMTTVDRTKLTKRIGPLPPGLLAAVEDGLKAALDLP